MPVDLVLIPEIRELPLGVVAHAPELQNVEGSPVQPDALLAEENGPF